MIHYTIREKVARKCRLKASTKEAIPYGLWEIDKFNKVGRGEALRTPLCKGEQQALIYYSEASTSRVQACTTKLQPQVS